MSFADTITITINSVAKVLNRINQDGYSSEYLLKETTGSFRLFIRNTTYTNKSGRLVDRHNVEFLQTIYAVAPSEINTVRKSYMVIENEQKDVAADVKLFNDGYVAFFTASSGANITKLLNFES
jgi:thermostable 8-oxoguanine DNA glycosylase